MEPEAAADIMGDFKKAAREGRIGGEKVGATCCLFYKDLQQSMNKV